MILILRLFSLPLYCFAADPVSKVQAPSLEEIVPEQHGSLPLPLCREENSEEMLTYAVGDFFASEWYNLVVIPPSDNNQHYCMINYENLLTSKLQNGLHEFMAQRFDFELFRSLIAKSINFRKSIFGTFGDFHFNVRESAKDEFAMAAFEVAMLKWVARFIEMAIPRNFFIVQAWPYLGLFLGSNYFPVLPAGAVANWTL